MHHFARVSALILLWPANGFAESYKPPEESGRGMNIRIEESDLTNKTKRLTVVFNVPDLPNDTLVANRFELIEIYSYRQTNGYRSHDTILGRVYGPWSVGEEVSFTVDVPIDYFDVSQNWIVRFCLGHASACVPSQNLLRRRQVRAAAFEPRVLAPRFVVSPATATTFPNH